MKSLSWLPLRRYLLAIATIKMATSIKSAKKEKITCTICSSIISVECFDIWVWSVIQVDSRNALTNIWIVFLFEPMTSWYECIYFREIFLLFLAKVPFQYICKKKYYIRQSDSTAMLWDITELSKFQLGVKFIIIFVNCI